VPFRLEPQVAGELGEATQLDPSEHPPRVVAVEYLLDGPQPDDLIESFPVFLASDRLVSRLRASSLTGFTLHPARVLPSREYREIYAHAEHPAYEWLCITGGGEREDAWLDADFRLCVSDRFMAEMRRFDLSRCNVTLL
jgi:hypothetical protein